MHSRLSIVTQVFWGIAALDALLLVVFLVMTLQDSAGAHDGGREMGIFFFIVVPAVALGLAAALFHFSAAWPLKSVALFIVLVPGLWFAKVQIEDRLIDRRIEADRLGTGYFDNEPLRQLGAAVVSRDVETLTRLAPSVDIHARGSDGMTLMRLAVRGADARTSDGSEMPVVRALLALGATPDDAMEAACSRHDPALLQTLLAAGADPNRNASGEPLVFDRMSNLTPRNFRLLAAHGLDLNSSAHGNPLPVQLTIYRRWDLLAIAIELGADTSRLRPDGRSVAGELASQIAEETQAGRELPADLLRARALLQRG